MSTRLLESLEQRIDDWLQQECEEDDWQELIGYCPPELYKAMARAAYEVARMNGIGQQFAKEQEQ